MSLLYITLLVCGFFIISALAFYAFVLIKKLRIQNQQQLTEQQNNTLEQNKKHFNSIKIITDAMLQEQCDLSEGCWRLSVLLDNVWLPDQNFRQQFPAIFALYEQINHMPIMEERKKLPKKERQKLDVQRLSAEQNLKSDILSNVSALHQWVTSLK
jgi:hypothetical protein